VLAKGYPLLFLALALVLRYGIRSAEDGRPGDWTRFAVCIGLSWAAHPSAALAGVAMLAWTLRFARGLGWKGILTRAGLAALVAAGPSLAVLPWLASRGSIYDMGHPAWGSALLEYFTGGRFTGRGGFWGADPERAGMMAAFAWEEGLAVGWAAIAAGLLAMGRRSPTFLLPLAAWVLPFTGVTFLFRIEGQMDFWLVAAGLPLVPACAAGIEALAARAGRRAVPLAVGITLAGAAVSVATNHRDLDLRGYTLAEDYGRLHLAPLDPGAVLLSSRDDVTSTLRYLQAVRGERRDVLTFGWNLLASTANDVPWFDRMLLRLHPELRMPGYGRMQALFPSGGEVAWSRAFLEANLGCGRPFYITQVEHPQLLPEGWEAVPAGVVWRIARKGTTEPRPEQFRFPFEAEDLRSGFRRKRGIEVFEQEGVYDIRFEPYERRLARAILQARQNLAEWQFRHGNLGGAIRLMESVVAFEPDLPANPWPLQLLGLCHLGGGDPARAAMFLELSVQRTRHPWVAFVGMIGLGDLARRQGDEARARSWYRRAAQLEGLSDRHRAELGTRLAPR
jgi:hypothetical protein